MKKVAVFVEGQTEQLFAAELIKQIIGSKGLVVDQYQFRGGKKFARIAKQLKASTIDKTTTWYFRIYDCHGGGEWSTVKSDIIEQLPSLLKASFSFIIGLRDVYPQTDIRKLQKGINYGLPSPQGIPVNIVLAVNEIEAWFLAEDKHYAKMSPSLTITTANAIAGIDLRRDTTETIPHPSEVLKKIYHAVGIGYHKHKWQVQQVVNVLDYANLYLETRKRNHSLNRLLVLLEQVMS